MIKNTNGRFLNKGVLSGIATILGGIAGVITSIGGSVPEVIFFAITTLAGLVTTKDSVDTRK